METRNRCWRRYQSIRLQKKRYKKWADRSLAEAFNDPKKFGQLKNENFGCGCRYCKPHKFDPSLKYKHSDNKKRIKD